MDKMDTTPTEPTPPKPTEEEERHRQFLSSHEFPRDAKIVAHILKTMGVEDYEPKVIHQLLEFMYRYVTNVLADADVYREHRLSGQLPAGDKLTEDSRSMLDLNDVRLASQARINHSFVQPPPRQTMLEMARKKNATPLPDVPPRMGVLLPHPEWCLTAVNYQIEPRRSDQASPGNAVAAPTTTTKSGGT